MDYLDTKKRQVPKLSVKPSTINDAGLGLFADENIQTGDHLGWYYGRPFSTFPDNGSHYILQVERRPCWVSEQEWSSRMRGGIFIDGQPGAGEFSDEFHQYYNFGRLNHDVHANVKFLQNGRVTALKPIKKGQELFVHYGSDFFE